ncbi:hypothetical protein [Streptomyces noursei]|uniref:hypothetical protein n=1 Tax=Streptomyces noursei TaxID=1971 RepID=UPI001674A9ED|nr:hypothetical protein [Streptomyces noursei]MCZ1021454.1 hypothetical protein [Streptomyces noursei]
MKATTTSPAPLFGTEDLITSTVQTPDTRPHRIRAFDLYMDGDKQGGRCVVCDAYGELTALRDLAPHAYGCTSGTEPFTSPAPSWL